MQAPVLDDIAALSADYPAWHIWRSRDNSGNESDWNATRKGSRRGGAPGTLPRLTAANAATLRALLRQQEALSQELTA